MTTALHPEVGRLRVRGGASSGARLVASEVSRWERRPAGLPVHGILVVRSTTASTRRAGAGSDPVLAAVEAAWRDARRPWVETAGDVPAVWFADEVELLAGLVTDLALGVDRWWWARVLPQVGSHPAAVLIAAARLVPAILQRTEEAGTQSAVLASLSAVDARAVAGAVARAFGASSDEVDRALAARERTAGGAPSSPVGVRAGVSPVHAWLQWLAEVAARRPASVPGLVRADAARAPDGPSSAPPVLRGGRRSTPPASAPDVEQRPHRDVDPPTAAHRQGTATARGSGESTPGEATGGGPRGDTSDPVRGHGPSPATDSPPADLPPADLPPADRHPGSTTDPAAPEEFPSAAAAHEAGAGGAFYRARGVTDHHVPAAARHRRADAGVATDLAGVVFLIDLLRSLGLPGALQGWPLERLGGGALVEAVARSLLRDPRPGESRDPVWRVLADLDGRGPDEPVGAAGLDGPLALPVLWRPREPAAASRPHPSGGSPLLRDLPVPLRRLGSLIGDHVEEWLWRRLVPVTAEPPSALLRQRGTVSLTSSHLDVDLPLDGLWLPGRLAGLDLDPGWVPWLGRVVLVHYR